MIACTAISNQGSQESSIFNQVFTLAKLVVLLFIFIVSLVFFNISNFSPLLSTTHPEEGPMGLVVGATLVFYAYLGYDIIPAVAEEAKDPKRDVPRALIHQVLYTIVIYVCVAFAVNGVGRLENFQGETAIAIAFEVIGHNWVAGFIFLCAFLGITASAFINMMGQSRLLYSLAKDGLFFERFKELCPKKQVPVRGSWISCFAVCVIATFLDVEELTFILSIENLFTFSFVSAGLLAMRFREKPEQRHKNEWYAWGYMLLALVFSLSWGYSMPWPVIVVLGLATLAAIVGLHFVP